MKPHDIRNIKIHLKAAQLHSGNVLVDSKLREFWKAHDELVMTLKLVDNGELEASYPVLWRTNYPWNGK